MENGYTDELSIDRIDNSKGYSPDNCRWVTPLEQSLNRTTTIMVEWNGEQKSLYDLCISNNKDVNLVRKRYHRMIDGKSKWTLEECIFTPKGQIPDRLNNKEGDN